MKNIVKIFNNKYQIFLILILFLAAILRFYQLGNIPYGTNGDEAGYIYNAFSIWKTGKDVLGKFLPLSFNAYSSESPVPVYLSAPIVGFFGVSLFTGRALSALLGIGSVFLIFLLADLLFENKRIALFASLLLSISPWALQVSRGFLIDVNFALFFLLLGIYIFIKFVSSNKFFWSMIPFSLAFYSFHATKVFILFLIPVLLYCFRPSFIKRIDKFLVYFMMYLLLFFSFIFVIKYQDVTRQDAVNLFISPQATIQVNSERQNSLGPKVLREIFSNKPLYYLSIIRQNFLEAFSPQFLFIKGDTGVLYFVNNISDRGEFYILDLPFLLLGIYYLIRQKNKILSFLIFSLLIISVLPSTFTNNISYVDRDIMMLPFMELIIAYGMVLALERISTYKNFLKYSVLATLCLTYLFLFTGYLYQYYFRWPVYGAENMASSVRDLTNFISSNKSSKIYLTKQGYDYLLIYGILRQINPIIIQRNWSKNPAEIYNLTIFQKCLDNQNINIYPKLPQKTTYIAPASLCIYNSTPSATIVDRGDPLHVIWNIYTK